MPMPAATENRSGGGIPCSNYPKEEIRLLSLYIKVWACNRAWPIPSKIMETMTLQPINS